MKKNLLLLVLLLPAFRLLLIPHQVSASENSISKILENSKVYLSHCGNVYNTVLEELALAIGVESIRQLNMISDVTLEKPGIIAGLVGELDDAKKLIKRD